MTLTPAIVSGKKEVNEIMNMSVHMLVCVWAIKRDIGH